MNYPRTLLALSLASVLLSPGCGAGAAHRLRQRRAHRQHRLGTQPHCS